MVNRKISVSVYELSSNSVTSVDLGSHLETLSTFGILGIMGRSSFMMRQGKNSWSYVFGTKQVFHSRAFLGTFVSAFYRLSACELCSTQLSLPPQPNSNLRRSYLFCWARQVQTPDQYCNVCHERMEGSVT